MDEISRQTLEIFIEQTEDWALYIAENHYGGLMGISRNVHQENWCIHSAIYGSVCILRMFLQPRDGIALYLLGQQPQGKSKLAELLDLPGMSEVWRTEVRQARKWIADALAIAPEGLIYNGVPITRREVLEVFLYGRYGHVNLNRRTTYKQWQQMHDLFTKLQFEFISIVGFIFNQIFAIAEVSKREIYGLEE